MAINKKKAKAIKKQAETLKEQFAKKDEGEAAAKDFEEVTIKLNTELDELLETFRSNSIRILRDVHQPRPFQIFDVIDEQTQRIRTTVDAVNACIEPIIDNFFRKEACETLKQAIDIVCNSNADKYSRAKARLGEKVN